MAGYSGTPLPQKLGIKDGHRVALVGAPAGFTRTLGRLPAGATTQTGLGGKDVLDVVVVFVTERADLLDQVAAARPRMAQAGGLWIAWPKKSSGVATDVTENVIRDVALPTGLVDNKVCAIDDTWSGLRLVIRLEHRMAETPADKRTAEKSKPAPKSTGKSTRARK
jgi:Protein of unknown function (DUF3052)